MRKALATFAVGEHRKLLRVAMPTFARYARRHGYDLVEGDGDAHGRPAAWGKVSLLRDLLAEYDFVFWVDTDALIVDSSVDVETHVPSDAFQAYSIAVFGDLYGFGELPCTGVWALRATERAQAFLTRVWEQTDLVDHKWWEQAAVMRLTGWTLDPPFRKETDSAWDRGTFFLDERWDMLALLPISEGSGYIRHYCYWPSSSLWLRRFAMTTEAARLNGNLPRYWFGRCEQWARPRYRPITGAIQSSLRALRS